MMFTPTGASILRSLRLPALLAVTLLGTGCPSAPRHCDICEIKTAKIVVDEYDELEQGWEIDGATMTMDGTFNSYCPTEPSKSSCPYDETVELGYIKEPGTYDEELPDKMSTADDITVTVEVTLRNGTETVTKEANVTVTSKSTAATVRTPTLDP